MEIVGLLKKNKKIKGKFSQVSTDEEDNIGSVYIESGSGEYWGHSVCRSLKI